MWRCATGHWSDDSAGAPFAVTAPHAIDALRAELHASRGGLTTHAARLRDAVAPTATAVRDGTWTEIRRRDLVPGDIVRLAAGDRVPADARLFEARDLHVQQAALTGESMPAEKDAGDSEAAPRQPADARNVVFLGTSVVSGTATALVVATGPATAFGDIAARLSTRPPETEFERGTRQFALRLGQIGRAHV